MGEIDTYLIPPSASVLEALSAIDVGGKGVVFVSEDQKVLAVLTDGDVRRFIIHGGDLATNVMEVANRDFVSVREGEVSADVQSKTIDRKALPVVDENGQLLSILFNDKTVSIPATPLNVPVVIMAGGKGTRLYPYTQVLPKPLIPIGDVPITMHIMQHFSRFGCNDFTLVVNHQKELIKAYFSDVNIPYSIHFVDEAEPLGTAGGLKLLGKRAARTFFLTNCDILIDADYRKIYEYHKSSGNLVTMVCAVKKVTIPYGTIELGEEGSSLHMTEKPTLSYLVNTGYYVVEPEFISEIPEKTFCHMPDVLQKCMDAGMKVGVYPISDSQWSDMGQLDEMEKMREKIAGDKNVR